MAFQRLVAVAACVVSWLLLHPLMSTGERERPLPPDCLIDPIINLRRGSSLGFVLRKGSPEAFEVFQPGYPVERCPVPSLHGMRVGEGLEEEALTLMDDVMALRSSLDLQNDVDSPSTYEKTWLKVFPPGMSLTGPQLLLVWIFRAAEDMEPEASVRRALDAVQYRGNQCQDPDFNGQYPPRSGQRQWFKRFGQSGCRAANPPPLICREHCHYLA